LNLARGKAELDHKLEWKGCEKKNGGKERKEYKSNIAGGLPTGVARVFKEKRRTSRGQLLTGERFSYGSWGVVAKKEKKVDDSEKVTFPAEKKGKHVIKQGTKYPREDRSLEEAPEVNAGGENDCRSATGTLGGKNREITPKGVTLSQGKESASERAWEKPDTPFRKEIKPARNWCRRKEKGGWGYILD